MFPAAAVAVLWTSSAACAGADQRQGLQNLRSADSRLAQVAGRIVVANARLCERLMPAIGATLHALDQYAPQFQPEATSELGFETLIAVEATVPGGPADQAGIRPGDGFLAINEVELPRINLAERATSASRDAAERAIADLPPDQPIALRFVRKGQIARVIVQPVAACRTRFEVLPAKRLMARSNGETIQISSGFVTRFDDSALAVAFAHELAHTILKHRAMLEAAGHRGRLSADQVPKRQLVLMAEREADRLSVQLLANAGYDPAIAPQFWREFGAQLSPAIFSDGTHDSAKVRSAALDAEIALIQRRQPH